MRRVPEPYIQPAACLVWVFRRKFIRLKSDYALLTISSLLLVQFRLNTNGLSKEAICHFFRGILYINLPKRMTKDDGWDLIHHYNKQLKAPLKCNNGTKSQEEHNLFRYRITILLWNMRFDFCNPEENNTTVILRPLAKGKPFINQLLGCTGNWLISHKTVGCNCSSIHEFHCCT